jgi:hypothetical protein
MIGTNNIIEDAPLREDAKKKSKEKMISATMSKPTIIQAHHGTKNESGNKEVILA